MPEVTVNKNNVPAPAFIGLESYSEDQEAIFFGRDEEVSKITTLIQVNTLTIVFGRSGTGKTSVLNAGVFPRLRKNYCLPFRIRLSFDKNSDGLVLQIKKVLKEEIDKYGFKVKEYPGPETLWEYFHKEPLWQVITPILVFDQFEEIFTLAKLNPRFALTELPEFWKELSDLIENNIPEKLAKQIQHEKEIGYNYKTQKIKVVFSFREEYLPEFESITSKIPSIKYSRFRLMPMTGHQAYEVITKTWGKSIKAPQAKRIVSYLTNETNQENYDLITVEPSLLSQVCAHIDKEKINSGSIEISAGLLDVIKKETILRSIYTEAVTAAGKALPQSIAPAEKAGSSRVQEFLEKNLITLEGYRTRYNLAGKDENLRPGLVVLQSRYFIREDDNTVELTHDVITPLIRQDRDERQAGVVLAAEKKKRRRMTIWLLLLLLLVSGLTYWLITYKANKDEAKARMAEKTSLAAVTKLKTDSSNLVKSRDSLLIEFNKADSALAVKRRSLTNAITAGDSAKVRELEEEIKKLKNAAKLLDEKKAKLNAQLKTVGVTFNDLMEQPGRTFMKLRTAGKSITVTDFAEYNELLKKYNALQTEYDKLKYSYDQHMRLFHNPAPIVTPVPLLPKFDTTNSWKLIVSGGFKQPGEMPLTPSSSILLIPDINANRAIVRKAKIYDINCNSVDVVNAKGIKTAVYYNGYFYFPDVKKGSYLIKICSYYGGYYLHKKRNGMDSVKLGPVRMY